MNRRGFLVAGMGVAGMGASAAAAFAWRSRALATAKPEGSRWRAFEVITRLEILDPDGPTRAWVPLPLAADPTYQKALGHSSTGNAESARVIQEEKYRASIFCAEWPAGEGAPVVEVTTRFATLDRATDLSRPGRGPAPDKRALDRYLEPTRLIPTDGIVRETSQKIKKGARTELEKARTLYEWIVENTFRDPKVRGCASCGERRSSPRTTRPGPV